MNDLDVAYAAGLFDGEGHIAIVHRKANPAATKKNRYERYYLALTLSQNREPVIRWLQQTFGGSVKFASGKRSYDAGRYIRWDWVLSTASAAAFLRQILPHLRVKAEEAKIALKLQSTVTLNTGRSALPADVVAIRRDCFERIRAARKIECRPQL